MQRRWFPLFNQLRTLVKAKVFIYEKPFDGYPNESNFKLIEEELPAIKNGEFLAEAKYLSVDPYMRGFAQNVPVGGPFILGNQVAKIIESKNLNFPKGNEIVGSFGWRTHTISNGTAEENMVMRKPYLLPNLGHLPSSIALGVLGMPGCTAYFGIGITNPKPGETLVVSGAAGAVGSVAGQIGKIKQCKVIGIAGSDQKGKWLVDEIGFDHFINYKTGDIDEMLKKVAPEGVDCYFDNTAGDITTAVVNNMNRGGRIAVCGIITTHNDKNPQVSINQFHILRKQLTIRGYNVYQFSDKIPECIENHLKWIKEGRLKYRETIVEGFENMPKAFIGLYHGENIGKTIVKVKNSC